MGVSTVGFVTSGGACRRYTVKVVSATPVASTVSFEPAPTVTGRASVPSVAVAAPKRMRCG